MAAHCSAAPALPCLAPAYLFPSSRCTWSSLPCTCPPCTTSSLPAVCHALDADPCRLHPRPRPSSQCRRQHPDEAGQGGGAVRAAGARERRAPRGAPLAARRGALPAAHYARPGCAGPCAGGECSGVDIGQDKEGAPRAGDGGECSSCFCELSAGIVQSACLLTPSHLLPPRPVHRPQFGATCFGVHHPLIKRRMFDVCIIDEAGQVRRGQRGARRGRQRCRVCA